MRLLLLALTPAVLLIGACEPARTPETQPPYPPTPDYAAEAKRAPGAIPEAFRGRWARDPEGCVVGGETRLVVEIDRLMFHESQGVVRALSTSPTNEVTIEADFEGEGESWSRKLRMVLSEDGQTLTIYDPDGTRTARIKCP
ncbi:MAG: hypothetical protein Q8J89_08855 [Caulobacter sp.]|nr:hypothetical protein [Caulobacter sp.]